MEIEVFDHQARRRMDLARLQRLAERAGKAILDDPAAGAAAGVLADLARVEIVIVDDEEIARVHEEFMGIPEPTDVITFDHGEIVISADRAAQEGAERRTGLDREIALYLIHGLLHLRGYDDRSPEDAEAMGARQEAILDDLWSELADEPEPGR